MPNSASSEITILSDRTPLLPPEPDARSSNADEDSVVHLRRVADSFPRPVWLIATIELCERFAYYGIIGPMQNYLQNTRNDSFRPGGIGLGQASATMVNQCFVFWCFLTPIFGAVVADQYIGRLRTITLSATIYGCGLLCLCLSSILLTYNNGTSLPALILALFLIGIGTGGIKTNVSSLVAEQYTGPKEAIRVTRSGEKVVVDRDLTIQSIFSMFFLFINVGSLAASVCTAVEQRYGFTWAFALPTTVFFAGLAVLLAGKDQYINHAPKSSIIFYACQALWVHGGNLGRPRSDTGSSISAVPWDDVFIEDLKRALSACKVFLLYPFYWAAYTQFSTNFVSQAATMDTHGIPNDIMVFLDPVTAIMLLPILDRIVFPHIQRLGVSVNYIHRMVAGFIFCGSALLYGAFVQQKIYAAPPCFDYPRAQDCMDGNEPNEVSIYFQIPAYVLIAISEILAAVAGIESAYTRSPSSMKSLVMAAYLSTTSLGALLALAVAPFTADPKLIWMYLIVGFGPLMAAIAMWLAPITA